MVISTLRSWQPASGVLWCEVCGTRVGETVHSHIAEGGRQERVQCVVWSLAFKCHANSLADPFLLLDVHVVVATAVWPPISMT